LEHNGVRVVKFGSTVLVIALAAGSLAAAQAPVQQPPAPAPAQPAAAPVAGQPPATPPPPPSVPASRKFTSDAGIMFSAIKPDKTADFEAVMARVKEALAKSQDPQRKQQALSWRVFKGLEAGPGGAIIYIWVLDPPVKDIEYVITDILREAFPNEAQDLWAKYVACFLSGQTMLNLQQVLNMSPAIVPK
jgi:hypothetical protein